MAVKSSGQLSFATDIVGEFGGSAPHALSEYKRGGSLVSSLPSQNSDIPTSLSDIQFSDFYGAVDVFTLTTSTTINGQNNRKQISVSSFIPSGGFLLIPSDMWVWSDSNTVAGLTIDVPCTIYNYGKIIGRGGDGGRGDGGDNNPPINPTVGGPAIKINSGVSGVTIVNYSGAYIAGGGGGGAGGGKGGEGETSSSNPLVDGGILNAEGDDASGSGGIGIGGGAGGSGGSGSGSSARSGGGGGRILPGTGGVNTVVSNGTAGSGGSAGNAGGNGSGEAGGGGGGWGAAGGRGGGSISQGGDGSDGAAGGKAIEDSGNSYSLTNNGTIYGATT